MEYFLTIEQTRRIKDNNLDYFRENSFSQEQKEAILAYGVSKGKIEIVKFYMDQDVELKSELPLVKLMSTNSRIDLLEYLASKGIDFSINDNCLLHVAIKEKKLKFAQFLSSNIVEHDGESVKLAIKYTIENFTSEITKTSKLLKPLLKHVSAEVLNDILSSLPPIYKESKIFVYNEYLKLSLASKKNSTPRVKI